MSAALVALAVSLPRASSAIACRTHPPGDGTRDRRCAGASSLSDVPTSRAAATMLSPDATARARTSSAGLILSFPAISGRLLSDGAVARREGDAVPVVRTVYLSGTPRRLACSPRRREQSGNVGAEQTRSQRPSAQSQPCQLGNDSSCVEMLMRKSPGGRGGSGCRQRLFQQRPGAAVADDARRHAQHGPLVGYAAGSNGVQTSAVVKPAAEYASHVRTVGGFCGPLSAPPACPIFCLYSAFFGRTVRTEVTSDSGPFASAASFCVRTGLFCVRTESLELQAFSACADGADAKSPDRSRRTLMRRDRARAHRVRRSRWRCPRPRVHGPLGGVGQEFFQGFGKRGGFQGHVVRAGPVRVISSEERAVRPADRPLARRRPDREVCHPRQPRQLHVRQFPTAPGHGVEQAPKIKGFWESNLSQNSFSGQPLVFGDRRQGQDQGALQQIPASRHVLDTGENNRTLSVEITSSSSEYSCRVLKPPPVERRQSASDNHAGTDERLSRARSSRR